MDEVVFPAGAARLREVCLHWADLRRATLRTMNLRRADLRGADLRRARLAGADLRDAIYNSTTRWPEFFSPSKRGCVPAREALELSPSPAPAGRGDEPASAAGQMTGWQ